MTPHQPNCIVDISDVWTLKETGMDQLESQMTFSGQAFPTYYREEHLRLLTPNWDELTTDYARGREVYRQIDRATHLYNGAGNHSYYVLAEAYRSTGANQRVGQSRARVRTKRRTLVRTVKLGTSNLDVPVVAVGCMRIDSLDKTEAEKFVQTALDEGANFFDHADIYADGACEEIFADAIGMNAQVREQVILQSK